MAWNPNGITPAFSQSRFSISFMEGWRMEYGACVTGLISTNPKLPVTGLCSSNKTAPNGKETMMALHLLSVLRSAQGGAHSAVHTFGRTVGNFDQANGGHCQQIFKLLRSFRHSSASSKPRKGDIRSK